MAGPEMVRPFFFFGEGTKITAMKRKLELPGGDFDCHHEGKAANNLI